MPSRLVPALLTALLLPVAAHAEAEKSPAATVAEEADHAAPVDRATHRNAPLRKQSARTSMTPFAAAASTSPFSPTTPSAAPTGLAGPAPAVPPGTATSGTQGLFGPPFAWPIIPIHVALLQDGRVLAYGTDLSGRQGAQLYYDIWDWTQGGATAAHTVLPNSTSTDIFCSGQSVMAVNGQVLISGGDLTIAGKRNYGQNKTTIFDPTSNTLSAGAPMAESRWYPTLIAMPDGTLVTMGGRQTDGTLAVTPEVYALGVGWTQLTNATSTAAFGGVGSNWNYPRAFEVPGGAIEVLTNDQHLYQLSTAGQGAITLQPGKLPTSSQPALPTAMIAPGQVLALRNGGKAVAVDFTVSPPKITPLPSPSQIRLWANATVMADGKVAVTGGSAVYNQLTGVATQAEVFDPVAGTWTLEAYAAKPRLYHSVAMLLPDATVLTAGGGAPGPVNNLNGEIFYPPYLYLNDGSGQPAPRPQIASGPSQANPGDTLTLTVGLSDTVGQVTFVRAGSVTHSQNTDQRFLNLSFQQLGPLVSVTLPSDPTALLPGTWMLFVFNTAGTPSVANLVTVNVPQPMSPRSKSASSR